MSPLPLAPCRRAQDRRASAPLLTLPLLALPLLALPWLAPIDAEAGPLMRRAEERQACQAFAAKLEAVKANPQQAQQLYQQGVTQLVAKFGSNPCSAIPAPAATTPPATATTPPAAPGAPPTAPSSPPASPAPKASAAQVNPERQQACDTFAARLYGATSSGNIQQAWLLYSEGLHQLTARFGANPCPAVRPPS